MDMDMRAIHRRCCSSRKLHSQHTVYILLHPNETTVYWMFWPWAGLHHVHIHHYFRSCFTGNWWPSSTSERSTQKKHATLSHLHLVSLFHGDGEYLWTIDWTRCSRSIYCEIWNQVVNNNEDEWDNIRGFTKKGLLEIKRIDIWG